jgi:hypothetical protein
MNTTLISQNEVNEIFIDEILVRDLADVELVMIGGGDIYVSTR